MGGVCVDGATYATGQCWLYIRNFFGGCKRCVIIPNSIPRLLDILTHLRFLLISPGTDTAFPTFGKKHVSHRSRKKDLSAICSQKT